MVKCLRAVLRNKFSIPRISIPYLESLALTSAIGLSGHMKVVINSISQARVSKSSHEHINIKEWCWPCMAQKMDGSLLTAELHVLQSKRKLQ